MDVVLFVVRIKTIATKCWPWIMTIKPTRYVGYCAPNVIWAWDVSMTNRDA